MNTTTVLLLAGAAIVVAVYLIQSETETSADRSTRGITDAMPSITGRVAGDGWQATISVDNPRGLFG